MTSFVNRFKQPVNKMPENGTGADRQLAVFEKTKNLVEVAKYIQGQYLVGV